MTCGREECGRVGRFGQRKTVQTVGSRLWVGTIWLSDRFAGTGQAYASSGPMQQNGKPGLLNEIIAIPDFKKASFSIKALKVMCCFTAYVSHVWGTRIFVAPVGIRRQLVVYRLSFFVLSQASSHPVQQRCEATRRWAPRGRSEALHDPSISHTRWESEAARYVV